MAASEHQRSSYIDYDTFLAPDFSATAFANSLVTSTNNPSDTPIDLSTPLSRVLFDVQEVDTHIHNLTTSAAIPLLRHTQAQTASAQDIFDAVSAHVTALSESYARLEKDVIQRHAAAEEVRLVASRLWVTLKIGRAASRALLLGRQLDAQMADVKPAGTPLATSSFGAASGGGAAAARKDDHAALVRAAHTLLTLRALFTASGPEEEGEHLARITVLSTLRNDLIAPAEQRLRGRAQQIVREFSLSSLTAPASAPGSAAGTPAATPPLGALTSPTSPPSAAQQTFAQATATKARATAALQTLYLLSFAASPPRAAATSLPPPALVLAALQAYLQAALSSSLASLARALAALPTLPRALAETAARCRNVVALESLLAGTRAPAHAALPAPPSALSAQAGSAPEKVRADSLLAPLLAALETASLPSFFWRSLASALSPRVAEVVGRGGAAARQLRGARESVRESIRDAVRRGCEGAEVGKGAGEGGWDREVGVMVGSVLGPLGR